MKKLLLAALLAAAPFAASAGELSYTYVEGGFAKINADDSIFDNAEANGGFVRGSYELTPGVNVFGGVSRVSEDFTIVPGVDLDLDLTQFEVGLGYHQGLSDRVDFIAELAWVRLDVDAEASGFSSDESANGGRGAVGIRGQFNDALEGTLKANYYDGGDFEGGFTGSVGALYKFNPTWGVTAEIEYGELALSDEDTKYLVGVRASF